MGTGVEVDPDSLFKSMTAAHIPDLIDLMQADDKTKFEAVAANTNKPKKKIRCYALLTPMLAQAIHDSDMSPAVIFTKILESIKVGAIIPATSTTTVEEGTSASTSTSTSSRRGTRTTPSTTPAPAGTDTEEEILTKMGKPYSQVLLFLWALHHLDVVVKAPTIATLQDDATILWDNTTKDECLPPPKKVTLDFTNTSTSSSGSHDGTISAMTKLSACMIKHQEAELRFKEEKSDTRLKAWKKLPKIQQNVLLLGGVEEDGNIPEECTEEMLSILGCQNGAQVEQYLRQSMQGHNMSLEPGFCTALNKGILVSPDDASTPKNFTPFLTPPVGDDDEEDENANLLKLAVQDKFDEKDLVLLTKMDVTIPMKVPCLKHHFKNYSGCAGRILGKHSQAHRSLKKFSKHIEAKETSYQYEFKQDKLFGGSLLDKVNWRFNRFLDSCAHGDADKIDTNKLDFDDIMEQVERREFNTKVPIWIKKLVKSKKPPRRPFMIEIIAMVEVEVVVAEADKNAASSRMIKPVQGGS